MHYTLLYTAIEKEKEQWGGEISQFGCFITTACIQAACIINKKALYYSQQVQDEKFSC